jgi:hypothetical protein
LPRGARLRVSHVALTSRDAGFNSDELSLVVMMPGHEDKPAGAEHSSRQIQAVCTSVISGERAGDGFEFSPHSVLRPRLNLLSVCCSAAARTDMAHNHAPPRGA